MFRLQLRFPLLAWNASLGKVDNLPTLDSKGKELSNTFVAADPKGKLKHSLVMVNVFQKREEVQRRKTLPLRFFKSPLTLAQSIGSQLVKKRGSSEPRKILSSFSSFKSLEC